MLASDIIGTIKPSQSTAGIGPGVVTAVVPPIYLPIFPAILTPTELTILSSIFSSIKPPILAVIVSAIHLAVLTPVFASICPSIFLPNVISGLGYNLVSPLSSAVLPLIAPAIERTRTAVQ
jgi:hypothetical protein